MFSACSPHSNSILSHYSTFSYKKKSSTYLTTFHSHGCIRYLSMMRSGKKTWKCKTASSKVCTNQPTPPVTTIAIPLHRSSSSIYSHFPSCVVFLITNATILSVALLNSLHQTVVTAAEVFWIVSTSASVPAYSYSRSLSSSYLCCSECNPLKWIMNDFSCTFSAPAVRSYYYCSYYYWARRQWQRGKCWWWSVGGSPL